MLPFDPKKPLFGFSAKFPHAKRRIHLFMDETGVFFRPKNAPPDWWGSFGDEGTGLISSAKQRRWHRVLDEIIPSIRRGHYYRIFDLPDPRSDESNASRVWRIWWRPDESWVEPLSQPSGYTGAFFWPRPARLHLRKASDAEIVRHFEREWNDPHSDVRAALPWCDWTLEERSRRSIRWQNGNEEELSQILQAAVDVAAQRFPDQSRFTVNAWWKNRQTMKIPFFPALREDAYQLMRPLLQRLETLLRSWCDLPNGDRIHWGFPWNDKDRFSARRLLWFVPEEQSAHERLEAALFLRDWLSQNAPDLLADWFPA